MIFPPSFQAPTPPRRTVVGYRILTRSRYSGAISNDSWRTFAAITFSLVIQSHRTTQTPPRRLLLPLPLLARVKRRRRRRNRTRTDPSKMVSFRGLRTTLLLPSLLGAFPKASPRKTCFVFSLWHYTPESLVNSVFWKLVCICKF